MAKTDTIEDAIKTVIVDGSTIEYDESKTQSWRAFSLLRKLREIQKQCESAESEEEVRQYNIDVLDALFELIENATGLSPDEVAELRGGLDVPMVEVVSFANQIVGKVYSKK